MRLEVKNDLATEARKYKTADEFVSEIKKKMMNESKFEKEIPAMIIETGIEYQDVKERIAREGRKEVADSNKPIEVFQNTRNNMYYIIDGNHRLVKFKQDQMVGKNNGKIKAIVRR